MTQIDRDGLKAAVKAIGDVPGWLVVGIEDAIRAYLETTRPSPVVDEARKFQMGDRVTKIKGSSWTGRVCGFYSTSLTPIGYDVESENEPGSVQLYPESALQAALASEAKPDPDADVNELLAKATEKFEAMSPEEQAAHREKQRQSYARSVEPCEHGVADWETCPDCREAVIKSTVSTSKPTVDMEPVTRWVPCTLNGEDAMQTTDTHEGWNSYVKFTDHQAQVDALQAKVDQFEAFKAALEFYADPKTYDPVPIKQARARAGGDPTPGVQRGTLRYQAGPGFAIPPIVADQNGNRARAALNPAGKDT